MSYMDVDNMRSMIANVYDSSSWRCRVAAMSDNQVIAVYYSFLEKGKFDRGRRRKAPVIDDARIVGVNSDGTGKDGLGTAMYGYQLSFDDLL